MSNKSANHLEESDDNDLFLLDGSLGLLDRVEGGGRWASLLLQPVDDISRLTATCNRADDEDYFGHYI